MISAKLRCKELPFSRHSAERRLNSTFHRSLDRETTAALVVPCGFSSRCATLVVPIVGATSERQRLRLDMFQICCPMLLSYRCLACQLISILFLPSTPALFSLFFNCYFTVPPSFPLLGC
jgi:hypothetical protein